MQDRAIVTIEGESETALKLSNGTIYTVSKKPDRYDYYDTTFTNYFWHRDLIQFLIQ